MASNKLKSGLIGEFPLVPLADVNRVSQREYTFTVPAIVAAATPIVERCLFVARRPCMITDVNGMSQAAITANDTNYFTITANKRTAAAPATAVGFLAALLKLTGGTGSWVAFTKKALSGFFDATDTKRILTTGDAVWVTYTHSGTGLQIEVQTLTFEVEELSD